MLLPWEKMLHSLSSPHLWHNFHLVRNVCWVGALLIAGAWPTSDFAEESAMETKAGYLYQFTRYVHWPQVPDHMSICAMATSDLRMAFTRIEKESTPQRPLHVREMANIGDVESCQIVYFCDHSKDMLPPAIANKNPVLLVGDGKEFLDHGGMIAFVQEEGRLMLEINLRNAEQAGLKLDPQLLEVARRVVK